jgi:predicted nucleic acid-binding protein
MALYFFDSSALVKRYVHEQGSVWVHEVTASASGHLIHISLLTIVEIASALARCHRKGSLSISERDRLFGAFLIDCARSYLLLRVAEDVMSITIPNAHHQPRQQKLTYGRPAHAMNGHGCTRLLTPRQVATGEGRPYLAPSARL